MDTNTKNSAIEEMAAGMVAIGTRANGKQTLSTEQAKNLIQPLATELHPQLSPIQHIRLTILTQTEQGKATAQSLAQTIWKPNLSIQTIAQNDFHVLSMLSEWVLTGQSHAIDEPPHCTVQTAQTNNDDSSPNVDPSHSQQPI